MSVIPVNQLQNYSPARLRLAESEFLLDKFAQATLAPHNDTLFLLTTYFDAFLFCYVSIQEMVGDVGSKKSIQAMPIFCFFKALRNVATHHCVLSGVEGKFPRPMTRIVQIGARENALFCVVPDKVEHIFTEILKLRPGEKRTISSARSFLASQVSAGGDILVSDLMGAGIEAVRKYAA